MSGSQLARDLMPREADERRFLGVTVAVVTNNKDPEGWGRVKLAFPWLEGGKSAWAPVATPMAGPDRGLYFLPEIDDQVLVAFAHGDPDFPYVLGALWNDKDPPPEDNDDGENNPRTIKSRSGHLLRFDDSDGDEKIEILDKDGKQTMVFDTAAGTITVNADKDIVIEAKKGKLKLRGTGVEIVSKAGVKIEAKANVDVKTAAQVNVKGSMIHLN